MKFIVITGGVMSGIGKGITASSIGVILKNYGLTVTAIKIDPYLNIDAGTMSPFEHGECFVLKDGGEADLDLGNYERFLNISLTKDHNITMGKIYNEILTKERKGEYLGKTVQVIPHVTNCIQNWIKNVANFKTSDNDPDICIIELGGTIGDIESMPFVEALRQMLFDLGDENMMFVHLGYAPILSTSGEIKTKPTQHSIQILRSMGINPNILCIRCEKDITQTHIDKIARATHIGKIIGIKDTQNIYRVPFLFDDIMPLINKRLNIKNIKNMQLLKQWEIFADKIDLKNNKKIISIVGKYTGLYDSYLSLTHAIKHAALNLEIAVDIQFIESTKFEDNDKESWNIIKKSSAVIIPGGFDLRGTEGMIMVIKYCRENFIPILGICYGMQLQVIEIARNVGLIKNATSEEFGEMGMIYMIIKMPDPSNLLGGTMRLGLKSTKIVKKTNAHKLYGKKFIEERHRHRYEVNPTFIDLLEGFGIKFSGKSEKRMEIIELPNHPFFMGCQFHPEYNTYPNQPHPLFIGLLQKTI